MPTPIPLRSQFHRVAVLFKGGQEHVPVIFISPAVLDDMVRLRNTKERKTLGRRGWERMVQDRMVEEACPEVQGALALIGRHRQAAAFNSVNQTGGTRWSDSF